MDYKKAMWAWFLANAYTHGRWGHTSLEREDRAHLEECGIDPDNSADPTVDSITEWGNTFNPEVRTPVIMPAYWRCNCGRYGSDHRNREKSLGLFVPGSHSIGDIIQAVLAVADRNDDA